MEVLKGIVIAAVTMGMVEVVESFFGNFDFIGYCFSFMFGEFGLKAADVIPILEKVDLSVVKEV